MNLAHLGMECFETDIMHCWAKNNSKKACCNVLKACLVEWYGIQTYLHYCNTTFSGRHSVWSPSGIEKHWCWSLLSGLLIGSGWVFVRPFAIVKLSGSFSAIFCVAAHQTWFVLQFIPWAVSCRHPVHPTA